MTWQEYFRPIAEAIKEKSKDENTKIGAVIVGSNHQIISTGYNSFPRGIDDTIKERQLSPEKHYWFSHAETNAIINAASNGVSTKGSFIYMTCGVPCPDCARNIINAGISKVVCLKDQSVMGSPDKWAEKAKRSLMMLNEAGVIIEYWD